jgi:cell division protein FtsW (lipid II flippase)
MMRELSSTEPPFVAPNRWEAVVPIVSAIIVDQIFRHIADPDRGTISMAFTLALVAGLRMGWRLWKHPWFWITWGLLVVFHVIVVAAFSWSGAANWNGRLFMPFAAADLFLVMAAVYVAFLLARGKPDELFADDGVDDPPRYGDRGSNW